MVGSAMFGKTFRLWASGEGFSSTLAARKLVCDAVGEGSVAPLLLIPPCHLLSRASHRAREPSRALSQLVLLEKRETKPHILVARSRRVIRPRRPLGRTATPRGTPPLRAPRVSRAKSPSHPREVSPTGSILRLGSHSRTIRWRCVPPPPPPPAPSRTRRTSLGASRATRTGPRARSPPRRVPRRVERRNRRSPRTLDRRGRRRAVAPPPPTRRALRAPRILEKDDRETTRADVFPAVRRARAR